MFKFVNISHGPQFLSYQKKNSHLVRERGVTNSMCVVNDEKLFQTKELFKILNYY